jgi:hypothetical protein
MECAFHLEMTVTESILELHQLATDKATYTCATSYYLRQQVETLGELTGCASRWRPWGSSLAT